MHPSIQPCSIQRPFSRVPDSRTNVSAKGVEIGSFEFRAKLCHSCHGRHQRVHDCCVGVFGQKPIIVLPQLFTAFPFQVEHPRFGRRTLHIAGMVGMCFSTAMIAISMLVAKVSQLWPITIILIQNCSPSNGSPS